MSASIIPSFYPLLRQEVMALFYDNPHPAAVLI